MISSRSACSTLTWEGSIYVAGGITSESDVLQTMEKFDPTLNTWQSKSSMSLKRRSFAMVEAGGLFYAIGGNNGTEAIGGCEVFDPKDNTWTPISPLKLLYFIFFL